MKEPSITPFVGKSVQDTIEPCKIKTNNCLILQYQRVALLCHDPLQMAVEPCNFEKQMEFLAENYNVVSIPELDQHIENSVPFEERTAAITFDGGYADIFYTALQVLEKYHIPATVFASTSSLMEQNKFWMNILENYLIANSEQESLEIEIDGIPHSWPLMTAKHRFEAYENLCSILINKTPEEQEDVINQITHRLHLRAEELDCHKFLDYTELKSLDKSGLITIGGHTHNYTRLSALSLSKQFEEVAVNKALLEETVGKPIKYFSYPFANEESYTPLTSSILEELGFSLAFGDCYGAVNGDEKINRFDLPRVTVRNWKPYTFYCFLKNLMG